MLATVVRSLGERGSYRRTSTGQSYALDFVWENPHAEVAVGDAMAVSTTAPAAGIRRADLGFTPARKDRLIRASGDTYIVEDVQPDGIAGLRLILQKG